MILAVIITGSVLGYLLIAGIAGEVFAEFKLCRDRADSVGMGLIWPLILPFILGRKLSMGIDQSLVTKEQKRQLPKARVVE